jgi:hypothetical protein
MMGLSRAQETTETISLPWGCQTGTPPALRGISISRHAVPLVWALRVHSSLGQSLAPPRREMMLLPVPVDIARADQPLELFWRQLFTSARLAS